MLIELFLTVLRHFLGKKVTKKKKKLSVLRLSAFFEHFPEIISSRKWYSRCMGNTNFRAQVFVVMELFLTLFFGQKLPLIENFLFEDFTGGRRSHFTGYACLLWFSNYFWPFYAFTAFFAQKLPFEDFTSGWWLQISVICLFYISGIFIFLEECIYIYVCISVHKYS